MNHITSPASDDTAIEAEIQAMGKTAPRVTPAHIQDVIASKHFFTGANGLDGTPSDCSLAAYDTLKLLTFCVLVLRNRFTVTGESACASPENFDAEIGKKIAYANAVQKIWLLEGYLLKQRLHDQASMVPLTGE